MLSAVQKILPDVRTAYELWEYGALRLDNVQAITALALALSRGAEGADTTRSSNPYRSFVAQNEREARRLLEAGLLAHFWGRGHVIELQRELCWFYATGAGGVPADPKAAAMLVSVSGALNSIPKVLLDMVWA